jgi:hypothetical protein
MRTGVLRYVVVNVPGKGRVVEKDRVRERKGT